MRILAIGNSFSQDASRYLAGVAKSAGVNIDIVNLMIGGCSLETHYQNMLSGEKKYQLEFNGGYTGFYVSLRDALLSGHWDVVTMQQVSHNAPKYETYTPYLAEIAAYVKKYAPKSKIYMHETWAYEEGSFRLTNELKYEKSLDMLNDVIDSYKKAAEDIKADGIIPSGRMMYKLSVSGIGKVHRDTFHASYGVGRYALSLLWLRTLCGACAEGNTFSDFDVPVGEDEKKVVWSVVDSF